MQRHVSIVSVAALGLGAVLSGACGFQGEPGPSCAIQSASATVSSPTGVFGPPDIAAVDRAYNMQGSCSVRTSVGDPFTGEVWTTFDLAVYAEYHPAAHEAREEIRGIGIHARSTWSCDLDPWVAADAHCTRTFFDGAGGKAYDYVRSMDAYPVSAVYLGADHREIILQHLIGDYKDKAALFPNPCLGEAEYTSAVLLPSEGQQVAAPAPVMLNVKRGAAPGCTAAIDGVEPVFDVEWEYADSAGSYTIAPLVASFDGRVFTHATPIPFASFAPYGTPQGTTAWRVRARLSLQPDAAWSDWVNFTLVDASQP
ncbi:MAG TPA: hypothetical protein VFD32_16735 [Dehalococcoidia bacterium]|nr:hypothetical protein [Dehalococcoidia bacterium]